MSFIRNRRILLVVITSALCGIILLGSGAIDKASKTNDSAAEKTVNIGGSTGGTLHDDFAAPNKDVYVENWSNDDALVRIRLSEYMELGKGAGTRSGEGDNQAISVVSGANINDPTKWTLLTSPTNKFSEYWEWAMGGKKYYYPVSPSKRGAVVDGKEYIDSGSPEGLGVNDTNAEGIHTKLTPDATVVSMDAWIRMDYPIGDYWVIDDEDGWIYWANIVPGGKSTGLLLDKVELIKSIKQSYYYSINVDAQIASVDDTENNGDYYVKWEQRNPYGGWTKKGKDLIDRILRKCRPTPTPTTDGGNQIGGGSDPTPTPTVILTPPATNTPTPTATNIATPPATNTPTPTATNIATPTATNTPTPPATSTPTPTATSTPTPTPPTCAVLSTPALVGTTWVAGKAVLSWDVVPGATKYCIYRALTPSDPQNDASYSMYDVTTSAFLTLRTYSGDPAHNKTWYFKVKAVNDCGESSFSNSRSYYVTSTNISSPIILDLNGDGVKATSVTEGQVFDHLGEGITVESSWVSPYDALLFRDLNGNGIIDNGGELFGNNTVLANGKKAANGFEALAELDINGDGRVDQTEGASIICVINGNFATLAEAGVKYINTSYIESDQVDKYDNEFRQIGSYIKTDGTKAQAADVWFIAAD
ncbi:MAG: hypothetical protein LBL96_12280 [Clostridiales bacterium]|jgi:hypothetical protein|nr:hypothetical protein [Clostridiales bacterium]